MDGLLQEFEEKSDAAVKKHKLFFHYITITVPKTVSAAIMLQKIASVPMVSRMTKMPYIRQQMINMSWEMHVYEELKKEVEQYVDK